MNLLQRLESHHRKKGTLKKYEAAGAAALAQKRHLANSTSIWESLPETTQSKNIHHKIPECTVLYDLLLKRFQTKTYKCQIWMFKA